MKLERLIATGCALTLMSGPVLAAPQTPQEAIAAITTDSQLLSGWLCDQLKYAIPFNSTSGNVVPSQLKLFGVEVGIEGVVSGTKLDVSGLRALNTTVVDAHEIDVMDRLPMPAIIAHAKVGLPFGLDGGIRYGGIPKTTHDEGDTHMSIKNTIIGFDVRKKVIEEGITRPFGLTVGLNFTKATGSIDATSPYREQSISGVVLSNAVGNAHTEWDTKSVGVQAVVNKKIAIINPYLGVSANKNFGSIGSKITNSGTITSVNSVATSTALTTEGVASREVKDTDVRALAGFELSILPFVKLGLQGEIANHNNLAAALGLRIQFR